MKKRASRFSCPMTGDQLCFEQELVPSLVSDDLVHSVMKPRLEEEASVFSGERPTLFMLFLHVRRGLLSLWA